VPHCLSGFYLYIWWAQLFSVKNSGEVLLKVKLPPLFLLGDQHP